MLATELAHREGESGLADSKLNFVSFKPRELKKIKLAWTGLNYSTAPGVLILHPSTPIIAPGASPDRPPKHDKQLYQAISKV